MLLQTNSYIVPRDKRAEHARLLRRFRQVLARLGCDHFEVYEQVGANWNTSGGEATGRVVQIMKFRDRRHQLAVQAAERNDPVAQAVIAEFCELINFPYQQQRGLFAVGFYSAVLPPVTARGHEAEAPPAAHDQPAPVVAEAQPVAAPDAAPSGDERLDARREELVTPFATGAAGVVAAGAAAAEALGEANDGAPAVSGEAGTGTEAETPVALTEELPSEASVGAEPEPDSAPEATAEALPVEARAAEVTSIEVEPVAGEASGDDTIAVVEDPSRAAEDAPQPEASGETNGELPGEEPLTEEDLDLSALLDPHLDGADRMVPPPLPHANDNGAHGHPGHRADEESLEGLLDAEGPEGRQNVAHGAGRG